MTGSDPITARYHGTLTSGSRMVRATWLMVPRVGVVARSDATWVAVISRPLPSRAPADPASPQCRPGTPEQTRAVRADASGGSAGLLRLPTRRPLPTVGKGNAHRLTDGVPGRPALHRAWSSSGGGPCSAATNS